MDFPFVPKRLVGVCIGIIEKSHKQGGWSSLLPTLLHKDTKAFIYAHKELHGFLQLAASNWLIHGLGYIGVMLSLIAAIYFTWWLAIGVVPAIFISRYFNRQTRRARVLIAAILLTLEMMANEFAGLGKHLPKECQKAREVIKKYLPFSQTRLTDIYFQRLAEEEGAQEFEALLTEHAAHVLSV